MSSKTTLTFVNIRIYLSHVSLWPDLRHVAVQVGLVFFPLKQKRRHMNSFKFKGISSPSHKINLNCFLSLWLRVLCWKNFDSSVKNLFKNTVLISHSFSILIVDPRGNFTQGEIDTVWGLILWGLIMFSCQETKPAFSIWPSVTVTVHEI